MHTLATDHEPMSPHPSLVLAAFAERFFEGRRVAILGASTTGLAAAVAARGARHVHVYDPDAARAAGAQVTHACRGVAYAALSEGEPGIRDGAYDVTLVPDLSALGAARAAVARARQVTSSAGVVVVATPYVEGKRGESTKAGPLNYYDLYDVLSRSFPVVKMAGQVPFQGYALVDFGAQGEPEVSVDTSLADEGEREPAFFLAVASERRVSIEPYAIVQLATVEGGDGERGASERAVGEGDRLATAELRARLEAVTAELDVAREARKAVEAKLHDEQRRSAELTRALSEAELSPRQFERKLTEETHRAQLLARQVREAGEQIDRLTGEARAQSERAAQQQRAAAEARSREAAMAARVRQLESQPRGVDAGEHQVVLGQLQALAVEHERLTQEHDALRERLKLVEGEATAIAATHVSDVAAAEAQLRERAREIAVLRLEIERRGALVRELLEALEGREGPSLGPSAALERERLAHVERELVAARERCEALTGQLARREGETRAAGERARALEAQIEQLREAKAEAQRVEATQLGVDAAVEASAQLEAARAEVEALRRALLQERQARLVAETPQGDEGDGQAAVLLEQVDSQRG